MLICKKHKIKLKALVCITGGCRGHFDPEDRCYCDSQDVHVEFVCPRREPRCYFSVTPSGLTDQYAIARWIDIHANAKGEL